MESAEFAFTPWYARLQIAAVVIVSAGALILFAAPICAAIYWRLVKDIPIQVVFVSAIGLYGLIWVSAWWRYRYVLQCAYELSASGITVRDARATADVSWSHIQRAEYFPLFNYARLMTADMPRPIVLFFITNGRFDQRSIDRNRVARQLLREQLGDKLVRRWVW